MEQVDDGEEARVEDELHFCVRKQSDVSEIIRLILLLVLDFMSDVMTGRFGFHDCPEIEKE